MTRQRKAKRAAAFSIARALAPLSPEDEGALCAFVAEAEKGVQDGSLCAWVIGRDLELPDRDERSMVCLRAADGETLTARGETIAEAVAKLSSVLISAAMKGAGNA